MICLAMYYHLVMNSKKYIFLALEFNYFANFNTEINKMDTTIHCPKFVI